MKRLALVLVLPFLFSGCSLNNGPDDGQKPDWDAMAPKIQARVKYVAAFAFTMDQVKPFKTQICTTTDQIIDLLNTYDDQEASFDAVRLAVMNLVANIPEENLRNAVTVFIDMVLTEAFNYAWEHYSDLISLNQVQTVVLIARAVGQGIQDACNLMMSINIMSDDGGNYVYNVFTVPGSGARGGQPR